MTVEAIIRAALAFRGSPGVDALTLELRQGTASLVGSGAMSAREATATFGIRQRTTQEAGVDAIGFADVLAALAEERTDTLVDLYHFSATGKVFTVFAVDDRLLGCVRVCRDE